jgi:hypothetical protein
LTIFESKVHRTKIDLKKFRALLVELAPNDGLRPARLDPRYQNLRNDKSVNQNQKRRALTDGMFPLGYRVKLYSVNSERIITRRH